MSLYTEKVIKEVETISDDIRFYKFRKAFEEIKEWAESEGTTDEANYAQFDIELCSLTVCFPIDKKNKGKRFLPLFVSQDGREYPSIKKFTQDYFDYYEQRLQETNNVFLKYRYADFLFEYDRKVSINKYDISKYLISSLTELVDYYKTKKEKLDCIGLLFRLVEVSLTMRNEKSVEKSISLIKELSPSLRNEEEYNYMYALSEILREILDSEFRKQITDAEVKYFIKVLYEIKNELFKNRDYEGHKILSKEILKYNKFELLNSEDHQKLQLEIGKGYELQSDYQFGQSKKSLIIKNMFLENALEYYKNIGESEEIAKIKKNIREVYQELEKSDEMKTICSKITIPEEIIEENVSIFVLDNIQESLDKIISVPIIPDIEKTSQFINEITKDFPLQAMMSTAILSNGKKIEQSITEEEEIEMKINGHYMLQVESEIGYQLERVFNKLISDLDFNANDIMQKLKQWGLLDNNNYQLIEVGMKRFFKEDYVSAMHILVPQFEAAVRNLMDQAGFSTTSIKRGTSQHEQTFNAFLGRENIKSELKKIDKNYHKLIQGVMVLQSGWNLRNNIAHGLIRPCSITKSRCIVVIYLFLVLTRYTIENE